MAQFVENRPVNCRACNFGPIHGKESQYKDRRGNTIVECRWVCHRCGCNTRVDEKVIPAQQQPAPKKDVKKQEK
jgi:hypothetical protein